MKFRGIKHVIIVSTLMFVSIAGVALPGFAGQPGLARPSSTSSTIEWRTNLYPAFQEALSDHKPMILYFYDDRGNVSQKLQNEVLTDSTFNGLSKTAVFIKVPVGLDDAQKNASSLLSQLSITEFPVMVVIDPTPNALVERGRIVGYFDNYAYYMRLSRL